MAVPLLVVIALLAALAAPAVRGADSGGAAASAPPAKAKGSETFAKVGDKVVTGAEYQRALAVAMRKKYYHAKPPEGELAKFQREVGDDVVNRVLLLDEAKRRGIEPDRAKIDSTVAGYDRQYGNSANWKANRDQMLANVVPQLERESILDRFEKSVRQVAEPTEAQARAYYEQHKDLFVEPEQVKLSVILLRVDPSSPQSAWNGALEEGKRLHQRLVAGADFAEMARLHSGDKTAASGGQMDYTHRGMLPETMHAVVDKLKVGELSEVTQILEGIAILRLDGRKTAQQRSFEQVRDRAGDLWQRAEGEARWKKLIADLRKGTPVRIDESHYAPLPGTAEKARSS